VSTLPGLAIGHATDRAARTGCTVLLGPFRGGCAVFGHATGTRELDVLTPTHIASRIDALLLTGGSAFGLAAADGVAQWLEARGRGFPTGAARVPIVVAAVIHDLGVGRADVRPDAVMGRAACDAATAADRSEGRVGAGAGASVGKLAGPARAVPGGIGRADAEAGGRRLLALAVVNTVGSVLDGAGRVLAGVRADDGGFEAPDAWRSDGPAPGGFPAAAGSNTTLAAIVTDAPLDRAELTVLARMAGAALARRITPAFTPYDGDIVFALTTAARGAPLAPAELLLLGGTAAHALEHAIERAVTIGRDG
jgi:L-aminopeptidase/D-esterase-like protein